jgi:hypothetical protein
VQDDELAAVIAALEVYARQQEEPQEDISAWKLAARCEAVAPFEKLTVTRLV